MLICISGASGTGKTTISKLIQQSLGEEDVLILSGDDLHRWKRTDAVWKIMTHLNPRCNDLARGYSDIIGLKNGYDIERRFYNHDIGDFDEPVTLKPKQFIIYEGLHALYDENTLAISDINIFVDTSKALRNEWKMQRDTTKRGYTPEEVIQALKLRETDEKEFIKPQKKRADIIVKFKKIGKGIKISYECVTARGSEFKKLIL